VQKLFFDTMRLETKRLFGFDQKTITWPFNKYILQNCHTMHTHLFTTSTE